MFDADRHDLVLAATTVEELMNEAKKLRYYVLPFNHGPGVDNKYTVAAARVYIGIGNTSNTENAVQSLSPQLSPDQRKTAFAVLGQLNSSFAALGGQISNSVTIKRAVPFQNFASILQLAVTAIALSNTPIAKNYTAVLGSSVISNFAKTRGDEADSAYTSLQSSGDSAISQVTALAGPLEAWTAACNPPPAGVIQVYPGQLALTLGHLSQTVIVTEAGYSDTFTAETSDANVVEIIPLAKSDGAYTIKVHIRKNAAVTSANSAARKKVPSSKASTPTPTPTASQPPAPSPTPNPTSTTVTLVVVDRNGHTGTAVISVNTMPTPTPSPAQ